jgi:hypothetical protein
MTVVGESTVAECVSCHQPLTGRYCANCGEKTLDPDTLTVRHFFVHTIVDELVHLDGKFWRTLRALLFRPGVLSAEYSAGRRRPYIKPARMLIASIITYVVLTQGGLLVTLFLGGVTVSIAPTRVPATVSVSETVRRIDRFGVLTKTLASKQRTRDITTDVVRERFHERLNAFAQPLSFANVLLLALALSLMFRRRRSLLLDHAAFSMHFVTFVLTSSLVHLLAVRVMAINHALGLVILLGVTVWQFIYLIIAIRRFYFGRRPLSRLSAMLAALVVYLLNSIFITGVQIVGGAIALRSI